MNISDEAVEAVARAISHMLASVWDEGQDAGANDQMAVDHSLKYGTAEPPQTTNPYRSQA